MYPAVPKTTPASVAWVMVTAWSVKVDLRQLGQSEIENFDAAVFGDKQIFWLQVAMDNALLMCRSQAMCDLQGIVERLAQCERASAQALAQGFALQQLGDNVGRAFVCADIKNCENVGMIQGGGGESLLLESTQAVSIDRYSRRQYFNGDLAFQAGIARAVDFAHSARAQRSDYFIRADLRARGQVHEWAGL
jgi:hypothetical protein